ncbi:hypothetical protein FBU30_003833 [Linnemannia zychae]|nr:hypothetical protein FBU30_003833 [Linnemannia zychae]
MNPLSWDPQQVASWLKSTFDFSEETLQLFIQNDIDGPILLEEIDHDALKNEFNIASFGKRCTIINKIRALRVNQSQTVESPSSGTISRGLEFLQLTEPAPISTQTMPHKSTPTIARLNHKHQQSDRTALNERRSHEEAAEIRLLEEPLRVWFDEKPLFHRQLPSTHKKRSRLSKNSTVKTHEVDSHFHGSSSYESDNNDTIQELAFNEQSSLDESDEPLAKKLLDRKAKKSSTNIVNHQSTSRQRDSALFSPLTIRNTESQSWDSKLASSSSGSGPKMTKNKSTFDHNLYDNWTASPNIQSSLNSTGHGISILGTSSRTIIKKPYKASAYLSKIGITLQDIFFGQDGASFESDSDDNWTMVKSGFAKKQRPSLYQEAVQANMKRILRAPPIFEIPGHMVYAPMRKTNNKDVPVRIVPTGITGKNAVVSSTWDTIFSDIYKSTPQKQQTPGSSQRLTINLGEVDPTSINFATLTKGAGYAPTSIKWATNGDDNSTYPLYGESDPSDYTTDEELYREIAKEDKERQNKNMRRSQISSKSKLSDDVVREIARIYIADRKETWTRVERPRLGRKVRKAVMIAGDNEHRQQYIDRLQLQLDTLSQKRLTSLLEAMVTTSYRNATEVQKACKSLDETIISICYEQWKLDILRGTEPIPDEEQLGLKKKSTSIDPNSLHAKESTLLQVVDEISHAIMTEDEAEEQRQRELDAAFIDDSDFGRNTDGYEMEADIDGDVSMKDQPTSRTQSSVSMPSNTAFPLSKHTLPATPITQTVSTNSNILSLPTPPFTATSPLDPLVLSDVEINRDEADRSRDGSDQKKALFSNHHRVNSPRVMTQPPSPIMIDLEEDGMESNTNSNVLEPTMKQEQETNYIASKDVSIYISRLKGTPSKNNTGSSSPANMIPKTLVTTTLKDEDDDFDEPDIPQPITKVRPMRRPNWRKELQTLGLTDDQLIVKLRDIGKSAHLGKNVAREEPYISVWQEYIEWIELDGGSSIGFKEFLAWKDEGNTTEEYREMARQAAITQGAIDRAAALEARKEKEAQTIQIAQERTDRTLTREKDRSSGANEDLIENSPIGSEDISQQQTLRKRKASPKKSMDVYPDAITIDSSDSDSDQDRLHPSSLRSTAKLEIYSTLLSSSKQLTSSQRQGDDEDSIASESATDLENLDSKIQKPKKDLKRRNRAVRNRFGDESSEDSSDEGSNTIALQPRPRPKRRKPPSRDEAQDVLLIRQNAAKHELEYQKRIKDQEQRARIRGISHPLLGDEILINPGHKKTERAVIIPPFLAIKLKPHQIDGLRFMWKNIVMFDGGCILAHSMGLGKTFQVVAFIYVLLTEIHSGNKDIPAKLQPGRVLLLMPPIVLQNWADEFEKWIPHPRRADIRVYKFSTNNSNTQDRLEMLERWHAEGGVFLMGYTMFRELSMTTRSNLLKNEDASNRFKHLLLSPGPSVIFADEGHTIKNANAKLSLAAKEINSTARVILTGYPLQNRLEEYWCMVDFVRPNFLGDLATFRFNYIRPISSGLHSESSDLEKKVSSKKLKVLTELIKNFVLRKDQSILRASLPKKYEFVISCKLSTLQYYLYTQILPTLSSNGNSAVLGNGHLLLTICNHPAAFKASTKDIYAATTSSPAMKSFHVTAATASSLPLKNSTKSNNIITIIDESDEEPEEKEKEMVEALSQNKELAQESWFGELHSSHITDASLGYKVKITIDILRACRAINEKVLLFSRSIPTLDYLQYATKQAGFKSFMLDGSTPIQDRQMMINQFNIDNEYDLFLISSGAGSQGVNLVSANRVIIFDVGWNPSHDEQSIARAFRYGQTRKVFVYRLQTYGTWEDKLYKTNLHKLGLSNRVVDKKNIFQAHSKTEMRSYFEAPPPAASNPRWATEENIDTLFKKVDVVDPVLKTIIQDNSDIITNIVPQSELVREVDSDLTDADMIDIQRMIEEEERRIKWTETHPGIPIPPLPGTGSSSIVRAPIMRLPAPISTIYQKMSHSEEVSMVGK